MLPIYFQFSVYFIKLTIFAGYMRIEFPYYFQLILNRKFVNQFKFCAAAE